MESSIILATQNVLIKLVLLGLIQDFSFVYMTVSFLTRLKVRNGELARLKPTVAVTIT